MPVSENAGRANRPDIKEIVSHTDDLKELLEARIIDQRQIMDERDRRYEDRFKAMDEKTGLALTASEKAVSKAEIATEKRFDAVNEFRATLSDQTQTLLSKAEAAAKFAAIEAVAAENKRDIIALREARQMVVGEKAAHADSMLTKQFDIRTILSLLALGASIVAILWKHGP